MVVAVYPVTAFARCPRTRTTGASGPWQKCQRRHADPAIGEGQIREECPTCAAQGLVAVTSFVPNPAPYQKRHPSD